MFVFGHMLGAEQLNIHTWVGAFAHKLTLYLPAALWVHMAVTNITENEEITNWKTIYMIWRSFKICSRICSLPIFTSKHTDITQQTLRYYFKLRK